MTNSPPHPDTLLATAGAARRDDDLISPAAAARLLGYSPRRLREKSELGQVPCVRPFGTHRRYERSVIMQIRASGASHGAPKIAVFPNGILDRA